MLLTIALIVAAIIAVAAFELSCFWRLGERDDRRRLRIRAEVDAEERRADSRSRGKESITPPGPSDGGADDRPIVAQPDGSTNAIAIVIATPSAIRISSRYSIRPRRRRLA